MDALFRGSKSLPPFTPIIKLGRPRITGNITKEESDVQQLVTEHFITA